MKKEIKSMGEKSKNIKQKVSTQESKDSKIEKLFCQNKFKDVSSDILYKDIRERNRKFMSLKMQLDD